MRKALLVLGLASMGFGGGASAADYDFKFNDSKMQAKFVAALRHEGIPFQTQRDGTVTYDAAMEERVSELRLAILHQSFKPAYHFFNRALEDQFTNRLKAAGISYELEMKGGDHFIVWSPQDNERVEKIRQDVLNTISH